MGFFPPATDLLLQEHIYKAISGRVLMVGRQNTGMRGEDFDLLLRAFNVKRREYTYEIDASTQHDTSDPGRHHHITDRALFHAFADCQVQAIDVSAYEGAEIVHDLSTPVPKALRSSFQFIFDGSTLDNVFDPVAVLKNITDMLAPWGRALLVNWSNSMPSAYMMPSPDWFMDFFTLNDFADAQVFVIETGDVTGRGWRFEPYVFQYGQRGYRPSQVRGGTVRATVCLAEKGPGTTSNRNPVQTHYRHGEDVKKPYLDSAERFSRSPRRNFNFSRIGPITDRASISEAGSLEMRGDGGD